MSLEGERPGKRVIKMVLLQSGPNLTGKKRNREENVHSWDTFY